MKWAPHVLLSSAALAGLAVMPVVARAAIHVSAEQSRGEMFPGVLFAPFPVALTAEQQARLKAASSISLPFQGSRIWKGADGCWFVVDEVVGKHEMITYAVGIAASGAIRRIEVLEYRESYGHEVAEAGWTGQFAGKRDDSPLKLGKDIVNISGATLSSKHLTDGVRRVMTLHAMLLRGL